VIILEIQHPSIITVVFFPKRTIDFILSAFREVILFLPFAKV